MDYILHKFQEEIDIQKNISHNKQGLQTLFSSRIEYILIFLLGYFWESGISSFKKDDPDEIRKIYDKIFRKCTLGDIVHTAKKLDINKIAFTNEFNDLVENFVLIRNTQTSHGYTYADKTQDLEKNLDSLYKKIINLPFFKLNIDYIYIAQKNKKGEFTGIRYNNNGERTSFISGPNQDFFESTLYVDFNGSYINISPFLYLENHSCYLFSGVEDRLAGKIRYNKLIETGHLYKEYKEFMESKSFIEGNRKIELNGTIRNLYDENINKYIPIGLDEKINDFLVNGNSTVCLTIWGHGGVGKTSLVHNVIDGLCVSKIKTFDYIAFLSAKNRRYSYDLGYSGTIESIKTDIDSFDKVIEHLNMLLGLGDYSNEESIINYEGKLLIIIDDFETFIISERDKIINFIKKLNINNHKVIITTRANIKFGIDIQIDEFNFEDTKKFFREILSENRENIKVKVLSNLDDEDYKKIFHITSGRPLFLYQIVILFGIKGGEKNDVLAYPISNGISAIEFLYGNIYSILGNYGKDIFVILPLITNKDDLENTFEKISYILKLNIDDMKFWEGVRELESMKIIEINNESSIYKVYTAEILGIMEKEYNVRDETFRTECHNRLNQINKDKSFDVDDSLLIAANDSRSIKTEDEVIDAYNQVINRIGGKYENRKNALLYLSDYLITRGRRKLAIEKLQIFLEEFIKEVDYIKKYTGFLWQTGSVEEKKLAITVLSKYLHNLTNENKKLIINLELSGKLLMYRSTIFYDDWVALKELENLVTREYFQEKRDSQIYDGKQIIIFGKQLFDNIQLYGIGLMQPGIEQSITTGFYSYLEVLIRLRDYKQGIEICTYIISDSNTHLLSEFIRQRHRILSYYQPKNTELLKKFELGNVLNELRELKNLTPVTFQHKGKLVEGKLVLKKPL